MDNDNSLSVRCPNCRASLRVKEHFLGKKGRCPKCSAAFVLPPRPAAGEDGTGDPGEPRARRMEKEALTRHAQRATRDLSSCDICGNSVAHAEMSVPTDEQTRSLVARGLVPYCLLGAGDEQFSEPSMTSPLFVRTLWRGKALHDPPAWQICNTCWQNLQSVLHESGDTKTIATVPRSYYERDWFRDILDEMASRGVSLVDFPDVESSRRPGKLANQIADASVASAFASSARKDKIRAELEKHGEEYGLAAIMTLVGSYSGADAFSVFKARQYAADVLMEWHDVRGIDALIACLRVNDGMLVQHVAGLLAANKENRALFDALTALATLLKLQDRLLFSLRAETRETHVPHKSVSLILMERQGLKRKVPEEDALTAAFSTFAICGLIRLLAAIGDELAHRALQEVYKSSLFEDDIIHSAKEIVGFDCPEDAEAVALSIAVQSYSSGFGEADFSERVAFLARHQSPAGRWAMERLLRVQGSWAHETRPIAQEGLSKISEIREHERQQLESRYSLFLEAKQEQESAVSDESPEEDTESSPDASCFIATATCGAHSPEVHFLRRYRDEVLCTTGWGRAIIVVYYEMSPCVARWIRTRPRAKHVLREFLIRPLARLAERNTEGRRDHGR